LSLIIIFEKNTLNILCGHFVTFIRGKEKLAKATKKMKSNPKDDQKDAQRNNTLQSSRRLNVDEIGRVETTSAQN
jgi:hypothetical protein